MIFFITSFLQLFVVSTALRKGQHRSVDSVPSNDEIEVEAPTLLDTTTQEDNPERWLLDFASNKNSLLRGKKFVLNIDQINIGTNEFNMQDQQAFIWHKHFGKSIRSNEKKITFSLFSEASEEHNIYTAWRSHEIMGRSGKDTGKFAWEGLIADREGGDVNGQLTCCFSWGALDCTILVFSDFMDSQFHVAMDEGTIFITRNPTASMDEELEPAIPEDTQNDDIIVAPLGFGESSDAYGVTIIHGDNNGTHAGDQNSLLQLGPTRATDIIVFYTEDAANAAGSSSTLENDIELRISQFNAAMDTAGITGDHKRLNLVATWQLFHTDNSKWKDWIGSAMSVSSLRAFDSNEVLLSRRDLVGADLMVLVHDWSSGAGIAYVPGKSSLTDYNALAGHTLSHEVGHNFGLLHCYGKAFPTYRTTMSYGYAKRVNQWAADSTNFWETQSHYDYNSQSIHSCRTGNGAHCCTPNYGRTRTLSKGWDRASSKGSTRISPAISGHQQSWSYRWCNSGVRGLGLDRYRVEGDNIDAYTVRMVCRVGEVINIGSIPSGSTLVERHNPRSCPGEEKISGVVLYRFRAADATDLYSIAVFCRYSDGWVYTPMPTEATYVSYDYAGHWLTAQPDLRDIFYIKWNRFRNEKGQYDTYNMDVSFTNAESPSSMGSLFQVMSDYLCMERKTGKGVVMQDCHGQPNQKWYITKNREIKNMVDSTLCLGYNENKHVKMLQCSNLNDQKWLYDKSTRRWSTDLDSSVCLDYSNGGLMMNACNGGDKDQIFVFDSYTFASLSN